MCMRFSFEDWNVKDWLKGNQEALKIVASAVVALCAINPQLAPYFIGTGAGTIIVKAVADVFHYYIEE